MTSLDLVVALSSQSTLQSARLKAIKSYLNHKPGLLLHYITQSHLICESDIFMYYKDQMKQMMSWKLQLKLSWDSSILVLQL